MRRRIPVTGGMQRWQILFLLAAAPVSTAFAENLVVDLSNGVVLYISFNDVTDANLSTDGKWIHMADAIARESVQEGSHRKDVVRSENLAEFQHAAISCPMATQIRLPQPLEFPFHAHETRRFRPVPRISTSFILQPWHILRAALCALVNHRQQQIIDF